MSKYTTEVRFICEDAAGYAHSVGYDKVEDVIDKSWQKVFDFDFPIFDENYRSVLCKKIIKHYYTREIGFETIGLWKLKLNMTMNEIMPYYNKLYETELLKFNPLNDADYTKTHEGEDAGSGNETGKHTGTVADAHEHGGTIGDHIVKNGIITDNGTHGGTVNDAGTHGGTVNDAGSKDSTDSRVRNEQLSESTWDVYSDTPQGALTNVENNTYYLINIIYIYCIFTIRNDNNSKLNTELLFDIINSENSNILEEYNICLNQIKYTNNFLVKAKKIISNI